VQAVAPIGLKLDQHGGRILHARAHPKPLPRGSQANPTALPWRGHAGRLPEPAALRVELALRGGGQHARQANRAAGRMACAGDLARLERVSLPEGDRVHADCLGQHIHVLLKADQHLRIAKASKRAGVAVVGEHCPRFDSGVRKVVRPAAVLGRQANHGWP
jgi:hypothetical protein